MALLVCLQRFDEHLSSPTKHLSPAQDLTLEVATESCSFVLFVPWGASLTHLAVTVSRDAGPVAEKRGMSSLLSKDTSVLLFHGVRKGIDKR